MFTALVVLFFSLLVFLSQFIRGIHHESITTEQRTGSFHFLLHRSVPFKLVLMIVFPQPLILVYTYHTTMVLFFSIPPVVLGDQNQLLLQLFPDFVLSFYPYCHWYDKRHHPDLWWFPISLFQKSIYPLCSLWSAGVTIFALQYNGWWSLPIFPSCQSHNGAKVLAIEISPVRTPFSISLHCCLSTMTDTNVFHPAAPRTVLWVWQSVFEQLQSISGPIATALWRIPSFTKVTHPPCPGWLPHSHWL